MAVVSLKAVGEKVETNRKAARTTVGGRKGDSELQKFVRQICCRGMQELTAGFLRRMYLE